MAIGFSAFTQANDESDAFAVFRYNGSPQAWNAPSIDQNVSNYSEVTGTPGCTPSDNICTYNIADDVVTQNTKGTLQ
ncbi:hypothetical protein [Flavobacterium sp.]|uniref:hypothetical protein n=1 Tax=Flavobacterium sp. TaxID=239 RepID=UPI003A8CBDEC